MAEVPAIRSMARADVDPAADVVLDRGWGDRRSFFRFAVDQADCRAVVATAGGAVVGTGVGTVHGISGWVGTVFVDPSVRRQGLGRRLTDAVIDSLRAEGCTSLVLAASAEGRPLYAAMGFRTTGTYLMLAAGGLGRSTAAIEHGPVTDWPGARIRPFRPSDRAALGRLDLAATGENRGHLIDALASPTSTRVAVDPDDRPAGFLIRPPWSGGAAVAPDPQAGIALLEERRARTSPDRQTRTALLAENAAGLAALAALGWRPVGELPRMVLGPEPLRRPEAIWGQFNFALG